MLTQGTAHITGTTLATPKERSTVTALMTEGESAISDAPLHRPEAAGALLLGLFLALSPKEPKERDRR